MRYRDLYVAGTGTWLPELVPVGRAVADGLLDPERAEQHQFRSAAVAGPDDPPPPEMAARAARVALGRAGLRKHALGLILHCANWFQGLDLWPAASYVGSAAGQRFVPSFEVRQRCNAGMGALELAAGYLSGGGQFGDAALITTGDRWAPPRVDRWNTVPISIYGDGGTALVLSREPGFARLVATCTCADNSLEELARGDDPFTAQPPDPSVTVDLAQRTRAAVRDSLPDAFDRLSRLLNATIDGVLGEAGIARSKLARVVLPNTRQGSGHREMHDLLRIEADRTTWEYGRTVGHLASGDQFAGLDHLVTAALVGPGDHVLLWGGGAGYTCTAAVLEILDVPDWS